MPRLPDDVTEVSDGELMQQMQQNLEWENFYAAQVAKAEELEAAAEEAVKMAEAAIILTSKKGELNIKRAERDKDPEVQRCRAEHANLHAKRKLITALMESRTRTREFLSRELTRRMGREPSQRRVDRATP